MSNEVLHRHRKQSTGRDREEQEMNDLRKVMSGYRVSHKILVRSARERERKRANKKGREKEEKR